MKKLFLLSVVALLSVSLLAQEKKMVEFAKTVYDFGTVAEGSGSGGIISTTFSFKNLGSSPIFIENARTSCGCTTPKVDLTKRCRRDIGRENLYQRQSYCQRFSESRARST